MIVKLRRGERRYRDLISDCPDVVIGIEADDLRILNDEGRPFLYPARIFRIADPREPDDWVSETGEDGERYACPAPLNRTGFFEDFFDGDTQAVRTFWRTVNEQLAAADGQGIASPQGRVLVRRTSGRRLAS